MKNNVRQMIKSVVEENAVSFKENTSKTLYSKVSKKLEEQYVNVSKHIFKSNKQ